MTSRTFIKSRWIGNVLCGTEFRNPLRGLWATFEFRKYFLSLIMWLSRNQHIFKNARSFKHFDKIHQLKHKQTIEVIELVNNGKEAQAKSALSKLDKIRRDFIYNLVKSVYEDDKSLQVVQVVPL